MRRSVQTAIIPLLAAVLALMTALAVARGQTGPTPPPPPGGGTPIVSTPTKTGGPSFRSLSKKQKTQIEQIVKKDKTFKKLTHKRSFKITNVWLWTTRTGAFLGGVVTVSLKRPATIKGTWLDLAYDCTEQRTPPYGRVPYKATYANVTTLTVYVDSQKKRVAGIQPFGVLLGHAQYPIGYKSPAATNCSS